MSGIKIDYFDMALPEWGVIKSHPIHVPLTDEKSFLFEIPSVDKYFQFESRYTKFIAKYMIHFSGVTFVEYQEFKNFKFKKELVSKMHKLWQIKKAKKDFLKIIKKYFIAQGFNIKDTMKEVNPIQLSLLFIVIHKCIETVKKKFLHTIEELDPTAISGLFSTSLKGSSTKPEPRY